jgi:hypothetical protein
VGQLSASGNRGDVPIAVCLALTARRRIREVQNFSYVEGDSAGASRRLRMPLNQKPPSASSIAHYG